MDNDLHGNVPHDSSSALLLIDVMTDFDFKDGAVLADQAASIAKNWASLKSHCAEYGIPCIYVNDNFGQWRSDFHHTVQHALATPGPGHDIAELLIPQPEDYFVLKPRHSAFYATPLELLLSHLHATDLLIAGLTTDMCILMTAADAYVRQFSIRVPRNACAAIDQERHNTALRYMEKTLRAHTDPIPMSKPYQPHNKDLV
jgi:nicotinamidase-related amidase